jgi:hypothetical protein
MIFVLLWKLVQFLVFLPLAGAEHMGDYLPFALELLIGLVSLVLSMTRHHAASFAAASVMALAALGYWWFVICVGKSPIWSDFAWGTVPDFLFAVAALIRWLLAITQGSHLHQGPMEAENV